VNLDYLDNSTEAKARRNTLIASGITFLIANLKMESNVLEILSLKFIIEPTRLVAVGQIISCLLLGIFLLRAAPRAIEGVKNIWLKNYIKRENEQLMSLSMDLFGYDGEIPNDGSPDQEFKDAQYELTSERERKQKLFEYWKQLSTAFATLFVDFVLPFTLALLAIFSPYSVSVHLIPFAQMLQ
jgi:hypothetical protein